VEGPGAFEEPVWRGKTQSRADGILVVAFADTGNDDFIQAAEACFQTAQRFLESLLESTANGHDFADGFQGRAEIGLGIREFW
jgi:hypothetical protein